MSKELEACFKEIYHEIEYVYDSKVCSKANKNWSNDIKHYDNIRSNVLTIQRYLEAIDNSNPSEALKDLERIGNDYFLGSKDCLVKKIYEKEYNTIKNYILKEQEPKQYLKWEDLETTKIYKCLLNGNEYFVDYFPPQECDPYWRVRLISPNRGVFIILKENYDKQFFNDLHLERVEE